MARACPSRNAVRNQKCFSISMFLPSFKGLHALAVEGIKDAELLSQPVSYSGMTNLRRLYEHIPMPGGLAVVGDSLAGFNPVLTTAYLICCTKKVVLWCILCAQGHSCHFGFP